MNPAEIPAAVSEMIHQVGLVEKTSVRSALLSGGQKRKLSVGIALIADSKVVFLVRCLLSLERLHI
jgi:ATP-binding cassette subfamily A (ABC1) protein 3